MADSDNEKSHYRDHSDHAPAPASATPTTATHASGTDAHDDAARARLPSDEAIAMKSEASTNTEPFAYEEEDQQDFADTAATEHDLNVTEDDLLEANEIASQYTLEQVRDIMVRVYKIHRTDPNFPSSVIRKISCFLENEDVFKQPSRHQHLIQEMKLEAALVTSNSPYAEVRAVVSNKDDPKILSSTIRAWIIGLVFGAILAFINQLFDIRQPAIRVMANVAQLLAYPIGKAAEQWLPDYGVTVFGIRHSLNPGPFTRKEHMLITIMANVAYNTPYTNYIIWVQYLPQYFNQGYASHFAYQILIALSTNFIGYGIAGVCRRFLVYPSFCVWPASLVTIALNSAFHTGANPPVAGPFRKIWRISRLKFFYIMFVAMFIWFWFPNYIFTALSKFNWMSWISPNHRNLNIITGINNGLGMNPFPTFDWNVLLWDSADPLMVPFFSTLNRFIGAFISFWVVLAFFYKNVYNTGYIPINSNRVWNRFGDIYNISKVVNSHGIFNATKYNNYSPPYLSAGNVVIYMFFFGIYTSTLTYTILYHHNEIAMGFKALWINFRESVADVYHKTVRTALPKRSRKPVPQEDNIVDVHNRLMQAYPEVPGWWYLTCLLCAIGLGVAAVKGWETQTTVGVVFYGLALCLVFVIPVGIIKAMTGIEVTLNVLAEFIGGSWVDGNALAMNYFKSFGYVTCAHAVWFCNDLKLAHYVKIPPRQTFAAQMVATFVSTLVCVGVLNFQLVHIKNVCTEEAKFKLTCPGVNTFFTSSVLWGTVGPTRTFGHQGQYSEMLVGFPLGVVVVVAIWLLNRKFPHWAWTRQIHPVALMYGGIVWAPYNMSYIWPSVPIAYFSWIYLKSRYVGLWSKYNFVLSAAWSCGIAIAGIIIFFGLQYRETEFKWWGNTVSDSGCEHDACTLYDIDPPQFFGPAKWN